MEVRLPAHLVDIGNRTYRFKMSPATTHAPHDDTDLLIPDATDGRPQQTTRRRILVRANGLVIGGGLAVGDVYARTHGPDRHSPTRPRD